MSTKDKVLAIILGVLILVGIGAIVYIIASATGKKFTEFYMLGQAGKAGDYPRELMVGETATVLVVIVNHEDRQMAYQVVTTINGIKSGEIGPVMLEYEERWEQEVVFIPTRAGPEQKVEFLLYEQGQTEVYQSLHLWVDVTQ